MLRFQVVLYEATKPFSGAGEVTLKQQSAPIAPIKQRGSIMWNIISALIYYFIIEPRWKLTSSDIAGIRSMGSQKSLHRT
jgi:hypothetical protein